MDALLTPGERVEQRVAAKLETAANQVASAHSAHERACVYIPAPVPARN
ncbi:hypothetical protein [Methylocystis bryophila]|nr:hypothetical protein [Methylocystis bryophila]